MILNRLSDEECSSQLWTQFMQLRKEPEKKDQDFNGIWTRDVSMPVRRSNQLSYEQLMLRGGQLRVHMFLWKR